MVMALVLWIPLLPSVYSTVLLFQQSIDRVGSAPCFVMLSCLIRLSDHSGSNFCAMTAAREDALIEFEQRPGSVSERNLKLL